MVADATRPHPAGPPRGDGPDDAEPCHRRRPRDRPHPHLLRAARVARDAHHRGHAAVGGRTGIPRHTRHPQGGARRRPGVGWPTRCTRPDRRSSCSSCTSAGCPTPPTPRTAGHPLAPSAIAAAGDMFTATGPQPMPVPREMTEADLAQTIADFRRPPDSRSTRGRRRRAARRERLPAPAVPEHATPTVRTDGYGGDIAGRIRFPSRWRPRSPRRSAPTGSGIRISPGSPLGDIEEDGRRRALRRTRRGARPARARLPARRASRRRGAAPRASVTAGPAGWCSTAPVPTSTAARRTCATDWPMS